MHYTGIRPHSKFAVKAGLLSSTSRNESEYRKYQRTAQRITTGSVCRHLKIAGRVAILGSLQATSPIQVAGELVLLEQEAVSIPGLSLIGSIPHLAAEPGWLTTFTFVNKSATSAISRTSLLAANGSAFTLPVSLPQQPSISGPILTSSLDQTIAPSATFVVQVSGSPSAQYLEGSAQLAATGAVDGFAVFHYNPTQQEAVVPMETRNAPSYVLAFDNTGGVLTGVALENVSTNATNIDLVMRDDAGDSLGTESLPLSGSGHTSFVLSQAFPQTASRRGTVEFDTPVAGQIGVLGIRYAPSGTLTTIPALANVGTSRGLMGHLAAGDGWRTTFVLVNTGASAAQANLNFFDDNGNPLPLSLSFPQSGIEPAFPEVSVNQTIAANASLWIQSTGPVSSLLTGSAQLMATGNISGFAIFRYNPNGQEAVVPLETRNAGAYLLAFDNTNETATGVAISTVSMQGANVPVIVRDDTGAQIGTGSIPLAANGHYSQMLTTLFPITSGIRGTAEFDTPSGAQISVLGIRSPPALTFTTLPPLAK